MNDINERIKQVRNDQGLTQSEFGAKLKLGQSTVAQIEKGIRSVTERTLDDVCRVFNVRKEFLLKAELPMYKESIAEDEFLKAATQISIEGDKEIMDFLIKYWKLDDEKKKLLKQFLKM